MSTDTPRPARGLRSPRFLERQIGGEEPAAIGFREPEPLP